MRRNKLDFSRREMQLRVSFAFILTLGIGFVFTQRTQADSIFDKVTNTQNRDSGAAVKGTGAQGSAASSSIKGPSAAGDRGSTPQIPRFNPYDVPGTNSATTGQAISPAAAPLPAPNVVPGNSSPPSSSSSSDFNSGNSAGAASSAVPGGNQLTGINNAINRGVQSNLQRGLNQGANAIDQLGRKVGIPGLGSILRSNSYGAAGGGGLSGSSYSNSNNSSVSDANGSPIISPAVIEADKNPLKRNRVNWDAIHAADSKRSTNGKAEYDAVARRAQARECADYLRSAQQAEARGDWVQAVFAYRQAMGADYSTTPEDNEAAARNHTGAVAEMLNRQSRDPHFLELNKKWAYCAVHLLNMDYSGQKTGIDPVYVEEQLHMAHIMLMNSDRGNATWHYLNAVYLVNENYTTEWNYLHAGDALLEALRCPRTSPSVRAKCQALLDHIQVARETQRNDVWRARYNMEQDLIWNIDHPTYLGDKITKRESINKDYDVVTYTPSYNTDFWPAEEYGPCKKDLAEHYPAFKAKWLKLLAENVRYANPSIPVPPAASNEDVAFFAPAKWEQSAFGPLHLAVGRKYPFPDRPGVGHFDLDCLPS